MTERMTKAIIPAAGLGTRLLPATKSQPKEMLALGRKPVIQYVLEELQEVGLNQILIITGRRKRAIEDHFDSDPQLVSALKAAGNEALLDDLAFEGKSKLFYTRQSKPRGLGHAVSLGADFVDDDDCVVSLGDSVIAVRRSCGSTQGDDKRLLRSGRGGHGSRGKGARVGDTPLWHREHQWPGAAPGEPVAMTDIVEKPPRGTAPSTLAVAARYVFSSSYL